MSVPPEPTTLGALRASGYTARDVRTELLLKLTFSARAGRSSRSLLRAQRRVFAPIIEALARAAADPDADLVDQWRFENAEAVRRFLAHASS